MDLAANEKSVHADFFNGKNQLIIIQTVLQICISPLPVSLEGTFLNSF